MPVFLADDKATVTTSTIAPTQGSTRLNVKFDIPVDLHLSGGPPEAIKARIYRVSAGLVELSSPVYCPHNLELRIVSEGRAIESRVAYCRRESNGSYDLGVRIGADAYIRSETRTPVDLTTRLVLIGSPGTVLVRIVDLSPSGVGMELPMPLAVGARVGIALGYSTGLGEIRHCARSGSVFRAGVQLEKLIRRNDASGPLWTDSSGSSDNAAALSAFEHSIEQKQAASEAMLALLAHPPADSQ